MENQFVIPGEDAQAILEYLADRPFREVFKLIATLQAMEPLPENHGADRAEDTSPRRN